MPDDIAEVTPAKQTDDEIIAEIIENCSYMRDRWADIREQGRLNMKCLSVEGLFPQGLIDDRNKKENPRPLDHTDIISFANNRVVNQWRMNPRGVQVNQTGQGATAETATYREERLREIAYSSQAKSARLCAFQNIVDRGYGAWEVYLDYESPRSSKQKICIGRIPNPNSVLIDPDTTKADRSDAKMAAKLGRKLTVAQFKRKYPKARDIGSFPPSVLGLANQFVSTDGKFVTPGEYWRVVPEEKRLLTLSDGTDVLEDEADQVAIQAAGLAVVSERKTEVSRVEHFITNGLDILSRDVWPGSTIPILFGVAREKYVDDELTVEALTAKGRVPQLHFDLVRSNEIEAINMTPKSKWVVSDEQIAGYETMWDNAHRDPSARLMVHERGMDGQPIAHPERTDYEPPIQGLEMAANSFLRDAQNTLGMTTIEKVEKVSKSGVAQRELNEAQDIGTFHLTDNMIIMVEYEGRICNELLTKIEDSKRTVGLREPSGKYKTKEIVPMEGQHPYGPDDSHDVTITTGPDYQSQREEAVDFLTEIVKNPDFPANPFSPMVIKGMEGGPMFDKMEKVAIAIQPPHVQAAYAEDDESGGQEMSPVAIQTIEKLKGELTALNKHAETLETQVIQLEEDIKGAKVKAESQERISAEDNATKIQIEEMKAALALQLKQLDVEIRRIDLEKESIRAKTAFATQGMRQAHESSESERDRQHVSTEAEAARIQEAKNGE